ncbi:MAG TPA: 4-(cytidine 5'-diphospho)-2-C-methyl-D-erythritol kinase [Gemmatimonadaceae bacterium]|jgi:4-diphosphocytidyl-2-C-methyl-D-erythritol kinase|nr:4-(cytidine 5'-diphospho)-2-C-methyl-D-erythritol kinase [Gemmatimonadaceae bacterium]
MSGRAARMFAQAKINLALRVFGKESNGYHSIETVFLRLDLGDDVEIRTTSGARSLRCFEMRDKRPEENLAYRAAEVFASETGWPKGFEIEIVKNIPIAGGLGGGSADAAAVLQILNTLSSKPMATEKLLELASRVGSDTPFLASDYVMALSWGRGERLLRLKPLPSRDVQLFVPPFGIDTGQAYALLDEARGSYTGAGPQLTTEMFRDWNSAAKNSVNDFETVMRRRHKEIDMLLSRGERHGLFYRMSGSGSTVFKIAGVATRSLDSEDETSALEIPEGTRRIVTRTAESVVPVELLD